VVLDRKATSPDDVVFRAHLSTPTGAWNGEARVLLADGAVSFAAWTPESDGEAAPPAWLTAHAQAFLRTEWRARRGPDPEPWPTRVNRWREERE
jgi:hypothetical protein